MVSLSSISVLVTGATGNLGRAIVKALAEKGYTVKAGSTQTKKTIDMPESVEAVRLVYEQPQTVDLALKGVNRLLLMAPPLDPDAPAKLKPTIDKARAAGVQHIVFISALGVDQNEKAPLRIIEHQVMDSGVNYTIMRPTFFMENFSTGFLAPMVSQGAIYLAAAEGKTSFISTADIAATVTAAFDKKLYGQAYNLTGPVAIDHTEAARIISEISGRKVVYHAIPEEEMLKGARSHGMPEGAVQYMGVLYHAVRNGWCAIVTDDVRKVTGKDPISFAEFAKRDAALWEG
jgi:uncharacterized protein YbjT (DUF2867 family)